MDDDTARLALPLLASGQAQKDVWHNEALAILDIAVQAGVEEVGRDTPPDTAMPGRCWIVGTAPTGPWAGHAGAIAGWTAGGWRFVAARPGLRAWDAGTGQEVVHDGTGWVRGVVRATRVLIDGQQVLGPRGAAVPAPSGGSIIDFEARVCLAEILITLRDHGLISH